MGASRPQVTQSILRTRGLKADSLRGKRVGVVGGGLGGLCHAYECMQLGATVKLFEARKTRVGGRARTYSTFFGSSNWVEAGCEFIGEQHSEWWHYAQLFGLTLSPAVDYAGPFSPIIPYPQNPDFTEIAAAELSKAMELVVPEFNQLAEQVNPDAPWDSPRAAELDTETVYDVLVDAANFKLRSGLLLDAWIRQIEANQGVHPRNISLLGYLSQIAGHGIKEFWSDTESYRCEGGVSSLVNRFYDALGEKVAFGQEVQAVRWTDSRARIVTKDGAETDFDFVSINVPVALMRRIQFEPALPEEYFLSWGRNTKFFAAVKPEFPVAWGLSPLAIVDEGRLQLIWEATAGQQREIKVITAFSGGKDARELSNIEPAKKRDEACLDELEALMPGFRAALVRPDAVFFKSWPTSEFTSSGYSCPAPGDVTRKWKRIFNGLGPLFFVGEAYSPRFWAFMAGALESAVRAASHMALRS